MTDAELKRTATESVVKHWSRIICLLIDSFERSAADDGEAGKRFNKLPPETKSYVEYFVKVLMPVLITRIVYANLGTEKLRSIFESLLSEEQPLRR